MPITIISTTAVQYNSWRRSSNICTFRITIAKIAKAIAWLGRDKLEKDEVAAEVPIKALFLEEYHEFLLLLNKTVNDVLLL